MRRQQQGNVIVELALLLLMLTLGVALARAGWTRGSVAWATFGAFGPALALSLFSLVGIERLRLQPPLRAGIHVAVSFALMLVGVASAATLRAPALLLLLVVPLSLAAGFAAGLALRGGGGRVAALDERLLDLTTDWPLNCFTAYVLVVGGAVLWGFARAKIASGNWVVLAALFGAFVLLATAGPVLAWLWQRMAPAGRVRQALRWAVRGVALAVLFGVPLHFLTLMFFIVLGGPVELLPLLYVVQATVVVAVYLVWMWRESRPAPPDAGG